MRYVILAVAVLFLIGCYFYFRDPPVSPGDRALTAVAKSKLCLDAQAAYMASGKDTSDIPECRYLRDDD